MNDGSAASKAESQQTPDFVRPGFNNIAPYILSRDSAAYGFSEGCLWRRRTHTRAATDGSIMHAEVGIGDS